MVVFTLPDGDTIRDVVRRPAMIDENRAVPCRPQSDSRISDKHKVKIQRLQPDIAALGTVVDALDKLDEPQRLWVLQTAVARFSLRMQTEVLHAKPSVEKTGSSSASDIAQTQDNGERSPKTFIREKSPQSDVQRITCLASTLPTFVAPLIPERSNSPI